MEQWKDCFGWENFYQVSDLGNVRSKKRPVKTCLGIAIKGGKVLKKIVATTGYEVVNFTSSNQGRKQELVHRLVLLSFVGLCANGKQACHANGVRHDNRLKNLRWGTVKENHFDQKIHGTKPLGEKSANAKLTERQVSEIKKSLLTHRVLADKYQVGKTTIARIKNGLTWAHINDK